MVRRIDVMKTTDDPRIYKMCRKYTLNLWCEYCPPHRGDNARRDNRWKSWKNRTKKKYQYQTGGMFDKYLMENGYESYYRGQQGD